MSQGSGHTQVPCKKGACIADFYPTLAPEFQWYPPFVPILHIRQSQLPCAPHYGISVHAPNSYDSVSFGVSVRRGVSARYPSFEGRDSRAPARAERFPLHKSPTRRSPNNHPPVVASTRTTNPHPRLWQPFKYPGNQTRCPYPFHVNPVPPILPLFPEKMFRMASTDGIAVADVLRKARPVERMPCTVKPLLEIFEIFFPMRNCRS